MTIFEQIENDQDKYRDELRSEMRGLTDIARETDEPAGFQMPGMSYMTGEVPPRINASEYLNAAVGWVYSCISAISDAVARNNIRLYKVGSGGEVVEVEEHPSLDLLDRVNNFTTRYDHFWLSQQYLELQVS